MCVWFFWRQLDHGGAELISRLIPDGFIIEWHYWKAGLCWEKHGTGGLHLGAVSYPGPFLNFLFPGHHDVSCSAPSGGTESREITSTNKRSLSYAASARYFVTLGKKLVHALR